MDKEELRQLSLAQIEAACIAWGDLECAVGAISGSHDESNALRMMGLLDNLLDFASQPGAPGGAARLRDFLTEWVVSYEDAHVPKAELPPLELLRHLMKANHLTQRDLSAEMGGQPNLSAVLNGRRQINARQAVALGRRFAVSAAAFLPSADSPSPVQSEHDIVTIDAHERLHAFRIDSTATSSTSRDVPITVYALKGRSGYAC